MFLFGLIVCFIYDSKELRSLNETTGTTETYIASVALAIVKRVVARATRLAVLVHGAWVIVLAIVRVALILVGEFDLMQQTTRQAFAITTVHNKSSSLNVRGPNGGHAGKGGDAGVTRGVTIIDPRIARYGRNKVVTSFCDAESSQLNPW